MTDKNAREYQKAIFKFGENINKAEKLKYVRDPIAWALYQTWKEFDERNKK